MPPHTHTYTTPHPTPIFLQILVFLVFLVFLQVFAMVWGRRSWFFKVFWFSQWFWYGFGVRVDASHVPCLSSDLAEIAPVQHALAQLPVGTELKKCPLHNRVCILGCIYHVSKQISSILQHIIAYHNQSQPCMTQYYTIL